MTVEVGVRGHMGTEQGTNPTCNGESATESRYSNLSEGGSEGVPGEDAPYLSPRGRR